MGTSSAPNESPTRAAGATVAAALAVSATVATAMLTGATTAGSGAVVVLALATVLAAAPEPRASAAGRVLGALVFGAATIAILRLAAAGAVGASPGVAVLVLDAALLGAAVAAIEVAPAGRLGRPADALVLASLTASLALVLRASFGGAAAPAAVPLLDAAALAVLGGAVGAAHPASRLRPLLRPSSPEERSASARAALGVLARVAAGAAALAAGALGATPAAALAGGVTLGALLLAPLAARGERPAAEEAPAPPAPAAVPEETAASPSVAAAPAAEDPAAALLRDAAAIVWEADAETGAFLSVGGAAEAVLGYPVERWTSDPDFWRTAFGAGRPPASSAGGDDRGFEARAVAADGRTVWLAGTVRVFTPPDGGRLRLRGLFLDVTERRRAERRLALEAAVARAVARAESLAAAVPEVLAALGEALDADGAFLWTLERDRGAVRCAGAWSRPGAEPAAYRAASLARTFGRGVGLPGRVWARGEPAWVEDPAADVEEPRGAAAAADGLRTAVAFPIVRGGAFLGAIELVSRSARREDAAVLAALAATGGEIGAFAERRAAEERLRDEVETLEAVGRLGPSLAGELDVETLVQRLTEAATRLVSARSGTFQRHPRDGGVRSYTAAAPAKDALGLPEPPRGLPAAPAFSSDKPVRIDDLRREASAEAAAGGVPPSASYLAVPVVSRGGRILGALAFEHPDPGAFGAREERVALGLAAQAAVALDNAELYAAERAARAEAESANRAKDSFLAILGHELRNPIGAIRNSVQALETSPLRDGAGEILCSIIERQTDTLGHLVDDLLDVSRLISGKIRLRTRVVDLKEVTERTLESLRAGGRASRHFVHVEAASVLVDGDPVRLEQIVTNLVENALKYTQAGGEIEIAVERVGEEAQLRVRDNGQGIEPDLLARVFDLFVQGEQSLDRPRGGLGLGLALVRRLAELHGGRVEAESAGAGRGSEFRVRLAARPAGERRDLETGAGGAPAVPRHVMIAEDHADSRESLRVLLELSGHRVEVAEDGYEALEIALAAKRPEIALIDIGLPRIDGYQVAREIRAADGGDGMYLVAVTGYGQPIDRRRAVEAGFNEHLVKPVDRRRLMRMLADVDQPRPARA